MTLVPLRYMAHGWGPGFLRGWNGTRFRYAMDLAIDGSLERGFQAMAARFPSQCDPSMLPEHAHDRQLIRGSEESSAAFVQRLIAWRSFWRLAGHAYSILMALGGYLSPHAVRIKIVTNRGVWYERAADGTLSWSKHLGTWDWDSNTTDWARYWIIIYPPAGLWDIAPADGLPGPWGLEATATAIKDVRRIVWQLQPLHMQCEWIVVALDPASFDETAALEPGGDWQFWSTRASHREMNRIATARYWRGQEVYT